MPHANAIRIVLGAASLAAPCADAQTAAVDLTPPELAEAKGGYTIFDPTPRELWRPLAADRPDATESPITVDAGLRVGLDDRDTDDLVLFAGVTWRF